MREAVVEPGTQVFEIDIETDNSIEKLVLEIDIDAENSIGQTELDIEIDAEDSIETPVFVEETHQMNEREELEGDVANLQIDSGGVHPSLSSLPGALSDIQSYLPTYAFLSIFGHPVRALIDSGASITMMSTELMKYIPEIQNEILIPAHYENMRSIDGSLIPLVEELKVNLSLNAENVAFGVTLCQSLYVPFILGADFLSQNDVTLDYHSNIIKIGSSQLPMY